MKQQKIKIFCHEKDCEEMKVIDWDGSFIGRWYCMKHAYKFLDEEKRKDKIKNGQK